MLNHSVINFESFFKIKKAISALNRFKQWRFFPIQSKPITDLIAAAFLRKKVVLSLHLCMFIFIFRTFPHLVQYLTIDVLLDRTNGVIP